MFLHCHTPGCGWSQDDFWECTPNGYSPLRADIISSMHLDLFKDKIYFDRSTLEEMGVPIHENEHGFYCTGTDYVAWELERRARRIRNMLVKTYEEFKAKKDTLVCPRCRKQNWDID